MSYLECPICHKIPQEYGINIYCAECKLYSIGPAWHGTCDDLNISFMCYKNRTLFYKGKSTFAFYSVDKYLSENDVRKYMKNGAFL